MGEYDRKKRNQLGKAISHSGFKNGQLRRLVDNRPHDADQMKYIDSNQKKHLPLNKAIADHKIQHNQLHLFTDNSNSFINQQNLINKTFYSDFPLQRNVAIIQMKTIDELITDEKITEDQRQAFEEYILKKSRGKVDPKNYNKAEIYIKGFLAELNPKATAKTSGPDLILGLREKYVALGSQPTSEALLDILSTLQNICDAQLSPPPNAMEFYIELNKRLAEIGTIDISTQVTGKSPLGKGKIGAVSCLTLGTDKKAFKPDMPPEPSGVLPVVASKLGIIPADARASFRSVAVSRLDELLGTDVIGHIERVKVGNAIGSLSPIAKGKETSSILKTETNPYDNPLIRKGLMNLQLLDAITGEVDRHHGNIFIDTEQPTVTGIDNDTSFGRKIPETLSGSAKGLPAFIDAKVAEKVLSLTSDILNEQLKELLTKPEIKTTIVRLENVQGYIRKAMDQPHANTWQDIDISKLNGLNSYFYGKEDISTLTAD